MRPKINTGVPACIPRDIFLQAAMLRLGSVEDEIQHGYEILKKYHKTVTVFGSARLPEDSEYSTKARDLSNKLAKHGYTTITGGGHGIMEAANHGALEAGGNSVGFNIQLPHEQTLNEYTTDSASFAHFSPRKITMTLFADAYVYFPGGFGTLDELAEILTLVQTQKILKSPIILCGSDFWNDLDGFFRKHMLPRELISADDMSIYQIVDDIDEIVDIVVANQIYCDHDDTTEDIAEAETEAATLLNQ
ncbi:MAG: TIGR00730 family Rossman fold protein [Candidatus Saccharimonadales bacterium]